MGEKIYYFFAINILLLLDKGNKKLLFEIYIYVNKNNKRRTYGIKNRLNE